MAAIMAMERDEPIIDLISVELVIALHTKTCDWWCHLEPVIVVVLRTCNRKVHVEPAIARDVAPVVAWISEHLSSRVSCHDHD
ncbi:hypothetical protein ACLOJK_000959 [Asimina triloba]